MQTSLTVVFALLAALLAVPCLSTAQLVPELRAEQALRAARSLKCAFPWATTAAWDRAESDEPQVKHAGQEFGFQIDGIDYQKGRARMIGNVAADDLTVIRGTDSVSFLERVPAGTVNLTTVYAWHTSAGRFRAVHSRHTAIGGPTPSQNYGYCQAW